MTKKEALKQAELLLQFVASARLGYGSNDQMAEMCQAKAEAAKAYIELAKMLDN